MQNDTKNKAFNTRYNKWVIVLSIGIPLVIAALFGVNLRKMGLEVEPFTFLPPIYAAINALTGILLVVAVLMIRKGKKKAHELLMKACIVLSASFLVLYIAYHMSSDSTPYGGGGFIKYLYSVILFTHIVLSIAVIPFVLITFGRALSGNFPQHKKIARITFPLWFYVAISGVVVYLMIAPYYG